MTSIRLLTEIPGPLSRALGKSAGESVAAPLIPYGKVYVSSGRGAVVEDVDGNRYIDLIGGVGCLITGHAHPDVTAAVNAQTFRSTHTDYSLLPYESYGVLAGRLSALCGGKRKVGFFNSGAEAVENAIKVARAATGRPGIVCFEGAFHGRTFMAMSLTHREVPYRQGFGPFVPEIFRAPYPSLDGATLEASVNEVERLMGEHDVAAVIVEPVLGEGGFVLPPPALLQEMARLCEANGSILIADEVQSGYGRTGKFLASDHTGTRPGIVILGKAIAAGIPLSAVVGDSKWMDSLPPNSLGGTYVGNPLGMAAGIAVLDVIERENLLDRAEVIGRVLRTGWEEIASRNASIKEIRGLGAMVGVEFASREDVDGILGAALQKGVMAMRAGRDGNVIRHLMPLVITDDQLEEAFEVFRSIDFGGFAASGAPGSYG